MKKQFLVLCLCFAIQFVYSQDSPIKLNDSAMDIYKSNPNKALEILGRALKISEEKKIRTVLQNLRIILE